MDNMDFKNFIQEEQEKHAVFAFGRMNPPTIGHEKLVNKVHEVAKANRASHTVVASHSQDPKSNPLASDTKLKHLKRFFPKTNLTVSTKEHPNFLEQAAKLHKQGVTHLHMVAGSDRTEEYHKLLHKYNGPEEGKLFNFKHITVHSAGSRDPDAEGAEGMSASKMREHARSGNFGEFKKGIPNHVSSDHAKELYNDVRRGVSLKEQAVRERYIDGQLFCLGERVYTKDGAGEIVYRGPNYVTLIVDGATSSTKKWLVEVSESIWKESPVSSFREAKTTIANIPAILMSRDQIARLNEENSQLTFGEYTTHNFDMCPNARQQFASIIKNSNLNPKFVMQAIQSTDNYLGIEKQAKKNGTATTEDVRQFVMQLSIAHDTLNLLGYPDSTIEYMKGHLSTMSDLSGHPDNTFANELGTLTPDVGREVDEQTIEITTITGRKLTKNIKSVDNQLSKDEIVGKNKSFKSIRESIHGTTFGAPTEPVPLLHPSEPEQPRDINHTSDKDVGVGLNKPEAGMVSFAEFIKQRMLGKVSTTFVPGDHKESLRQHHNAMRKAHYTGE